MVRYITHSPPSINIIAQYSKLDILKVDELFFLEISKFMYRHNKQLLPATFDQYFAPVEHRHNTRLNANNALTIPSLRTNIGKQSLKFSGAKVWNQIPRDIKEASTLDNFSLRMKAFIIQQRIT